MKIEVLIVQTHNRSVGYISQKSKLAALSKLPITELTQHTRYVWTFNVEPEHIKSIENGLNRATIAYLKVKE